MNGSDRRHVIESAPPDRSRRMASSQTTSIADLLERVLDKGIVIAGDITLALGQVEILNIKVRLLVASIDKAEEIGIDWWRSDPTLSSRARASKLEQENQQLKERLDRIEAHLTGALSAQPDESPQERQGADSMGADDGGDASTDGEGNGAGVEGA